MVEHIGEGIYDGIFFHRVIDDFVTQSGDPTCTTQGAYPLTTATCGSGGTGETILLSTTKIYLTSTALLEWLTTRP